MALFAKAKQCVGLDIGSSAIKLVELKPMTKGDKKFQLLGMGIEQISPEVIVDGTVMDAVSVIDAIERIFRENKIKGDTTSTGVSGNPVIIRKISLPLMSPEELAESIQWEAEQYIPFDIDEVNIGYEILHGTQNTDHGTMDVILAAVKKEKVNDYVSVIKQAGKNVGIVDVDAFALYNCFELNYPEERSKTIALVNIGANVMNINIVENGISVFWRDSTIGGSQYTEAVQKEMNLSYQQSENLKKGIEIDGISSDKVIPIINSVSETFLAEIQRTFEFYQSQTNKDHMDKVFLSGGSSRVPGLDQQVSERFGTPVEIFNPFKAVSFNPKEFDPDFLLDIGPTMVIAVGLATREV
ncbi:MAG: type IV pilus assembly protein PilM [Acidobacteria bacterium]|nr:type IV pilus assembly protein PilM [Acidobacteriota bacterium]